LREGGAAAPWSRKVEEEGKGAGVLSAPFKKPETIRLFLLDLLNSLYRVFIYSLS
jgi:hypothetical protein